MCLLSMGGHTTWLIMSDTAVVPIYVMHLLQAAGCCRAHPPTCAQPFAWCRQHIVCCRPQGLPA